MSANEKAPSPFAAHAFNLDTTPSNSPIMGKMEHGSPILITSPRVRAHSVAASEFFTIIVRGQPFQVRSSIQAVLVMLMVTSSSRAA